MRTRGTSPKAQSGAGRLPRVVADAGRRFLPAGIVYSLRTAPFVRSAERQFISYPKSGQSWIRYMLTQLDLAQQVAIHHDACGFDNNTLRTPCDFCVSRHLRRYRGIDRLVYLERDPRDVLVSLYFWVTERLDRIGWQGDISTFIRDPYFGAPNLRAFREVWDEVVAQRGFLKITYEQLHADAAATLGQMVEYYGFSVDPARVEAAAAASTFEKMREVERSDTFDEGWLRVSNDAPKMRSGRTGSYRDLAPEDVAYLNDVFALA